MTDITMPADRRASRVKPLETIFKWLKIFFIIYLVGEAMIAVGSVLQLVLGSSMFGPGQPFTVGEWGTAIGGLLLLTGFIPSIVLFCIFSVRAMRNLHEWKSPAVTTSPGWAAGWYFIPFANLWKPYGVMEEMFEGSQSLDEKRYDSPPIGIWWCCWILTNIISNISLRLGNQAGIWEAYATDVPLFKVTLWLDIVSAGLGIAAAMIILSVLDKITAYQDAYSVGGMSALEDDY